ncbi:MAG: hypothetical protein Q8Q39_01165 [bacterium]|nr:hypothetical protein [bacterium]
MGTMKLGGPIEINAIGLRDMLGRVPHWVKFDSKTHRIEFWKNAGGGGVLVLAIENASHENAARLAQELGLKGEGSSPTSWSRWYPHVTLCHDGSEGADRLHDEILRLGIPLHLARGCQSLELCDGQYRYTQPMWPAEKIISAVKELAERWRKQLDAAPKGI